MKALSLLLATFLPLLVLAAEPELPDAGREAAPVCHHSGDRYSPGAIIRHSDSLYRCVAAYDAELQRIFVWVRITDATQTGSEISILWQ